MALIYVVEDDKNIQEIETFALANVGYEVKGFDSATDFYAALNETAPDLILLDIMLPDEDGLSIVKKLRTRQDTVLVPVIPSWRAIPMEPRALRMYSAVLYSSKESSGFSWRWWRISFNGSS